MLTEKKKTAAKKNTVGTAKPKAGTLVTVKTLSGSERWNAPAKRKTKRRTNRLRGSDFGGILPAILSTALGNIKPVAGGLAAEMIVNTIADNFKSENSRVVGNMLVYIGAGVAEKMVSPKMVAVRDLLHGAAICAGKDAAEHVAKKLKVTSLSGYEHLAGYTELSGYGMLQGNDSYRMEQMRVIPQYTPALSGSDRYGNESVFADAMY